MLHRTRPSVLFPLAHCMSVQIAGLSFVPAAVSAFPQVPVCRPRNCPARRATARSARPARSPVAASGARGGARFARRPTKSARRPGVRLAHAGEQPVRPVHHGDRRERDEGALRAHDGRRAKPRRPPPLRGGQTEADRHCSARFRISTRPCPGPAVPRGSRVLQCRTNRPPQAENRPAPPSRAPRPDQRPAA